MATDTGKLVKAFIGLRDARAELRTKFQEEDAALRLKQERIEASLLAHMNESGQVSGKTPFGTFYKQEDIKPMGSDWDTLYRWIKETDAFECLERRITRTFISKYMAENDGAIPPGVSVLRQYVVRVRKN